MARHRKHIEKAQHHEALIASGRLDAEYPDWYITASFYAGVHWIRALLALNNCGEREHDDLHYDDFVTELRRLNHERSNATPPAPFRGDLQKTIRAFQDLKDLARGARYRCETTGEYARQLTDVDAALKKIKAFVTGNGIVP